AKEQGEIDRVQIKLDNGSESSGVRTQFLHRLVQLVDTIGKPLHLLYYPPYHSKYNPIERCWGIMELHWNVSSLPIMEKSEQFLRVIGIFTLYVATIKLVYNENIS